MAIIEWIKKKSNWLYLKIVHEKASPEYIARGWAIGMFCGCIIPFGLQLVISVPASFILKGSKIGATIGTFITNHFTIFIIYPFQCYVGAKLMGYKLTYAEITGALKVVLHKESLQSLTEVASEILASFFLGGAILALIMTPLTYFAVKKMVIGHRIRVQRKKKIKAAIAKK